MRRIDKWLLIGFGALIVLAVIGSMMDPAEETAGASPTATQAAAMEAPKDEPAATSEPRTPAAEATPTAEPAPTPEPAPTFDELALSGTGDAVPRFEIPADAAAIAEFSHTGTSNFAVISLAADGSRNALLVNEIGNYTGTVLFDERSGQNSVGFQISADGPWTATIRPVTAARVWYPPDVASGSGDDVLRVDPAVSGLLTANVSHTGSSNFAIIGYGGGTFGRDLLVNEIGAYDGEVLIADGTLLLAISADGTWSITPS